MKPAAIRAIRKKLGLTQAQLAAQLGVAMNTVYRWEHGDMKPMGPAERLLKILLDRELSLT